MFNNDNKEVLYRVIAMAIVLFGILAGGMAVSQNNVNASHVRHPRTRRMVRHPKRIRRNKIHRRHTRAARRVKRTKQSRKVRRMAKHVVKRKGRGHKKMTKVHKDVRTMRIERRSTSKDPASVTPGDQD